MIIYKNLVLLGSSHISIESIKEIKTYLDKNKPSIIALELDKNRYMALVSKDPRSSSIQIIRELGFGAFVINKIGQKIERELGKLVGVTPGSEMLAAINIANEKNIPLALIDQDIRLTLKRLSKKLTLKEKLRFVVDIFLSLFPSKNKIKIDLRKVPSQELIKEMILKIEERYPTIYKVLIEERNKTMSSNLLRISKDIKGEIFVIIGAGHLEGLIDQLKKVGY